MKTIHIIIALLVVIVVAMILLRKNPTVDKIYQDLGNNYNPVVDALNLQQSSVNFVDLPTIVKPPRVTTGRLMNPVTGVTRNTDTPTPLALSNYSFLGTVVELKKKGGFTGMDNIGIGEVSVIEFKKPVPAIQ